MSDHLHARPTPLVTMADGTIKQINPFSGTEVWTVPGRGNRPLSVPAANPQPLGPDAHTATCAFCSANKLSTPPEKSRMVQDARGMWSIQRGLLPSELDNSVAEFRRVPNLFEIVSYDYWQANYGFEMHPDVAAFMEKYLSDPQGREHVLTIVRTKLAAAGKDSSELSDKELLDQAGGFFAGGHDVIIGRRHYVDGAEYDNQLKFKNTQADQQMQAIRSQNPTKFTAMLHALGLTLEDLGSAAGPLIAPPTQSGAGSAGGSSSAPTTSSGPSDY